MTTMTCDEVQDRLPEWVEGTLPAEVAARVRAHLDACGTCSEALEVVELVAAAPRATPPHGFEEAMQEAARTALRGARGTEVVPEPDAVPSPRQRSVPTWRLAAAAGIVLALGTPLLVQRMQGPIGTTGDSAWVATGGEVASQVTELLPSTYVSDDPVVAGAPVLSGLSDEALLALLDEMEE